MTVLEAAQAAAERVRRMDYPDDLTEKERLRQVVEDAQLASGVLLELVTSERWQSTLAPFGWWLRIPVDLILEPDASAPVHGSSSVSRRDAADTPPS